MKNKERKRERKRKKEEEERKGEERKKKAINARRRFQKKVKKLATTNMGATVAISTAKMVETIIQPIFRFVVEGGS